MRIPDENSSFRTDEPLLNTNTSQNNSSESTSAFDGSDAEGKARLPEVAASDRGLAEASAPPKKDDFKVVKAIYEYLELFASAICIVFLVFMFGVRLCSVDGPSMNQTLYHGEKLLISNLNYTPERGDIIVFHQTGTLLNEPIVKRVIATGGEWVDLEFHEHIEENGEKVYSITVTVYDENKNVIEIVDESDYVYFDTSVDLVGSAYDFPMYVPEGYLFVMGDNRNHSTDSRNTLIGLVDERRVLGHVILRVSPFSKFGVVDSQ